MTSALLAERSVQASTAARNLESQAPKSQRFMIGYSIVKGILWCGDVTVERIKWGNKLLKKKITKGEGDAEISPETLKRIKRVKAVSRMTEKVATSVLSGIISSSPSL